MSPSRWRKHRVTFLQRLLLLAHVRSVSPQQRCQALADKNVKPYATYKLVILYFALIDQLYENMFNKVPTPASDAEWPTALADWIRHNDDNLLKSTGKILSIFQDDLNPATSVEEIIDVCGLMGEIPSPASFLLEILSSVPWKEHATKSVIKHISALEKCYFSERLLIKDLIGQCKYYTSLCEMMRAPRLGDAVIIVVVFYATYFSLGAK